ncbi:microtubule-associated tumor suppressor candidate 2 isoform X2 [Heteronotia binoei]|uniref:microtubule-associated tumor suppressor candidate 2 isoform X2 n=1 Tax=Heteronotia binoei TaxID=13085 RepID=UPI00292FB733|nr:microtubule-associated tumor suppressor candidate 2 isoform X2 [Heteronotia binoei]
MSTPLVPNKSCYNLIQDNRNEMKNNNENTMTVGDTNANRITSEVKTSGRKGGTNDLTGETQCLNIGKPENNTQLDSEWNRLQNTTGVSETRLPTTTNRELHKDYRADGVKDTSKIVPISRGHSLSNLRINTNDTFSVVLSKSDADLIQHVSKDRIPRRIEPEGIKRLSLGRSRKLTAKTEAFGREFVGRVSGKRLLSASLDSIDTSHHLTGDTETSQKTSVDHFLGMASDGNIVRYSKTTSETKKINVSATQMSVDSVPNFNKQSTSHPSPVDQDLTVKSNDICSKSEAQLDHEGDKRGKWELKSPLSSQPKNFCQQKMDRVIMAEFLRCQREENNVVVQNKKDYESEVHKVKSLNSQDDNPHLNEVVNSMSDRLSVNNYSSLGRGSSHSEGEAVNQVREKYVAKKEAEAAFCLTDDDKPSSKLTPTRNETMLDTDSSCFQAVGRHMTFVHSINPPDGKHLNDNESKLMLIKENSEHFAGPASNLLEQPKVLDTESVLDEHSNIQDNYLETTSFSVQSKKTLMAKKHVSDDPLESCKVSARTDTLVCVPTPLRPVATVNANNHPTLSSGNLKNLYAFHVDKLSPNTVLPPFDGTQLLSLSPKVPNKTACNSSIPKPILVHSKDPHPSKSGGETNCIEKTEENVEAKPDVPKPKHVRPKIITYIRRNPQANSQLDHSFVAPGLPYGPPGCGVPVGKESNNSNNGEIKPANMLYDKFKPDLQKPRIYSSGLVVSGIKSSGHHFSQMGEKFLQEVGERPVKEEFCPPPYAHYEVPPSFYRSAMILKPQLGLGAVSRLPSAKSRILIASQRSSASCIHQQGPITSSPTLFHPDAAADLKKGPTLNTIKSNLPKPCPSGLRPPGYSRLPAAKLAAFGFVRSSSVSSISSNQSNDSAQSDQSRTANRSTFGNEEPTVTKAAESSKEAPKGAGRSALQASSNTPAARKSLLPAPKTTSTPAGSKKEVQKDQETNRPAISSPKRLVVSATKLHSPGHPKQRSSVTRNGFSTKPDLQNREAERQFIQQMKEKCDEQTRRLSCIQEELRRTGCGFDVFVITTQHFFRKNENALVKEKELSAELANIKDEVALSAAKYEKLQKEKEELERRFEGELKKLGWQQREELQVLEERLQLQYSAEIERLQEEHRTQIVRLRTQHQEQVEDITAIQETAVLEMENNHLVAVAGLQDEYQSRVQELKSSHEVEKRELEENFEKLRLSLQDQVDTLTFQSQTLKDKAKRFEEALKKNTEEQLEVALAPYQHLEEDMNSLRQVLEMKNQLIHQQEKRIMELEKLAEKNLILEEKIQVLQQQNEDLSVRIHQNTVVTRQLSEENANLQEHVEKETEEKKRLSRTNEELLWKLQTAEPQSPVKLSPTSPTRIYRSSSGPPTPAKVSTVLR